jgi:MORN repeat
VAGGVWPTGRYDGELVDGEPNGHGTLIVQGVRYEGELRNGKPNGVGTLSNVSGTFRGIWKDGACSTPSSRPRSAFRYRPAEFRVESTLPIRFTHTSTSASVFSSR